MDALKIEKYLHEYGLSDYKWINPKDIVTAQWVRIKCQFGCSDYGLGTCPPHTPAVQECKNFFNEYAKGIIIRFSIVAEKENYPSAWSKETTKTLLELERKVFLEGYHKTFLFNQTCCCLCKNCAGNRVDCTDKTKSRPSPEAFAVDVFQTVRNCGFNINVVRKSPSQLNRIAILLIE